MGTVDMCLAQAGTSEVQEMQLSYVNQTLVTLQHLQ